MAHMIIEGYLRDLTEREIETQWGPQVEVQARIGKTADAKYTNLVVGGGAAGDLLRKAYADQNGKPTRLTVDPKAINGKGTDPETGRQKNAWVKFIVKTD